MEEVIEEIKREPLSKLMSGSRDLNIWLEGGYEKDIVTLLYGPAASGKSNFVTLAACHNAKKDKKIIFIDTEGGFSLDRVNQICLGMPEFVLNNIIILKPTSFEEQKKAFMTMLKELKSENVGLIIVDSMVMLYRLELAEARKKGLDKVKDVNSDLANQMRALNEIARKKHIPVLITTQVYNNFLSEEDWLAGKEAGVNIVGGDLLTYYAKCIIELKNNGKRRAIIRKHRSLPEKELGFEVVNEGIRKKGWL